MVVVPDELDGPSFATVSLYWPLPPDVKTPCATLVTARSKIELSVGGGVVAGPLFAPQPMHSFGLLTVTLLAGSGVEAPAEIAISKISRLSPPVVIEFAF